MMKFLSFFFFLMFLYFMKFFFFFICFSLVFSLFFFSFFLTDYYSGVSYFLGWDYLSFFMVLLTLWIGCLMILSSEKLYFMGKYSNFFILNLIFLMITLLIAFLSMNLFIFYLFFESSLVPLLILILGWGHQPERLQAGMYMFFYTFLASFPLMISIFYIYTNFMVLDFFLIKGFVNNLVFIFMILVFLVKVPMFFVHLWLPKAHVEAPVSGSMILAGVVLKLGGYGLMRFMDFTILSNDFFIFLISLSLFGSVVISFVCFRQVDFKSLIAYSSVSHMGMVLSGLMIFNSWGFLGSLIMMVGHGLSSSGLFCLINIFYERLGSRSFFVVKGLINVVPSMSLWWFLFCLCNMSFPPSLNFFGELMLMSGLVSWSFMVMFMLMFIFFLSSVYSLFLYSYSQYGKSYLGDFSFSSCYLREYLLVFLHWVPLNFLFLVIIFI
uniref:NADH-ubiquinone oxidoreductase chain 4 n=1 Tax=Brasilocerus sp. 2 DTA-2012 TaxID=1176494 RepID=A0A0H3UL19_9COLE|nr:NADH dehydrogenase subunit 4 [Brasilocerus sp. 2 DTA-2012]